METISDGFWDVFFLLVIMAMQLGVAVGFVWLIVHFATRKAAAQTDARLQDLEQRIARVESSTSPEPPTQ